MKSHPCISSQMTLLHIVWSTNLYKQPIVIEAYMLNSLAEAQLEELYICG